ILRLQPNELRSELARELDALLQAPVRLRRDVRGSLARGLDVDRVPVARETPGHARAAAQQQGRIRRARREADHHLAVDGAVASGPVVVTCARARVSLHALRDLSQRQLAQDAQPALAEERVE